MATEQVTKPPLLPPYQEMIYAALDAVKQKEGLNKPSISKYIESTYGDLPAGHTNLLTQHLNVMKESGKLIMVKDNYMKPNLNAPPPRGRGRPPKPKHPLPPGAVISPARSRGRPRKDPNAPPASKVTAASKTGRPRGRPRKERLQPAENDVEGS